jgi:hypothetical protein
MVVETGGLLTEIKGREVDGIGAGPVAMHLTE